VLKELKKRRQESRSQNKKDSGVKELKEKGRRSQKGINKKEAGVREVKEKEAGVKEVKLKGGRNQRGRRKVHCKKGCRFYRPQTGCHLPNSPWPGIIKLFPARES
jgi:hypothetical protein